MVANLVPLPLREREGTARASAWKGEGTALSPRAGEGW
jgi:hypothetical protein